MKNFLKKHFEWVLGFLGVTIVIFLGVYVIWGVGGVWQVLGQAFGVTPQMGERQTFDLEGAKSVVLGTSGKTGEEKAVVTTSSKNSSFENP